jgi:hypothetical protein
MKYSVTKIVERRFEAIALIEGECYDEALLAAQKLSEDAWVEDMEYREVITYIRFATEDEIAAE